MNANTSRLKAMAHNAARKAKVNGMRRHWNDFGQHRHPKDCNQVKFTMPTWMR